MRILDTLFRRLFRRGKAAPEIVPPKGCPSLNTGHLSPCRKPGKVQTMSNRVVSQFEVGG